MEYDVLIQSIQAKIQQSQEEIAHWGDYDTIVENAADGGNHNDTFSAGEDYGYIAGEIHAYEEILAILMTEDTHDES